ncbi:MAG: hypothetical protein ABH886_04100 [Candidatus Desantisbacteria bacterium]
MMLNYKSIFCLLLIMFFGILNSYVFGGEKMENKVIYAEMRIKNCKAELYVNDIPLECHDARDLPFIATPVHQYLIDGINEIELIINPGHTPSQARKGNYKMDTAGMWADVRLVRYPEGVFTGDPSGEILANVVWEGKKGKEEVFPKILSAKVDLEPMFGRWAWQDAEKIVLNEKTVSEILDVVKIVHEDVKRGSSNQILQLAKNMHMDTCRAYPLRKLSQIEQRVSKSLIKKAQQKDWAVDPLNPSMFDFRVCANGHMVEIINKDWNDTIMGHLKDSGDDYPFSMFLSRINGVWHIVR